MIRRHVSLIAAGYLLLAACGPPANDTSVDLVGSWRSSGKVLEFRADGTYDVGASEFGMYGLDGDFLTIVVDDEASFCPGTVGTYEVGLEEDGRIRLTLVEDECSTRASVANNSIWSPASP